MQAYQMTETESAKWDSDDAREMDAARREIRAAARASCERGDAVERARASEDEKMLENARLLNEREAMEGQIKALADALVNLRCIAVSQGVSEQHGVIVNADAALRLAGRL